MLMTDFLPGALDDAIYDQRIDCIKLQPGPFILRLDRFEGRNLVIDLGHSTSPITYSGYSLPTKEKLGVVFSVPGVARFRGSLIKTGTLNYLCPGGEMDGHYPSESIWASISIKGHSIDEMLRRCAGSAAADAVAKADFLILPLAQAVHIRLQTLMNVACFNRPTAGASSDALETELIDLLYTAFIDGLGAPPESPGNAHRRHQIMRQVREIVLHRAYEPITLTELAVAIGVSVRTIEYAFNSVYGVSAGTYLRMLRLNRAYRHLLEAECGSTTVTRVATHWGFWHMGEFGVAYKRLFGERPSDTLKRSAPVRWPLEVPVARTRVAFTGASRLAAATAHTIA